jgi:dihydroorotase
MAGSAAEGDSVGRFEVEDAWLVDPAAGRSGRASIVVEDGVLASRRWKRGRGPVKRPSLLVLPGLTDLHAHLREPGEGAAETVASGLAAAAHGGFTTICAMANTEPPLDGPGGLALLTATVAASGSPVRVLPAAATTVGRAGTALAPMAALAAAGVACFSDDGSPVADAPLLRKALLYAGALGSVIVEHPEDPSLSAGAEAHEGLAATILGLRGWPVAAESGAVARDIEILAQAVAEAPPGCRPRLHLTHLSTARSIELVRAAKQQGLPVTCDVTPHHLALHDGWLGGDRRYAWQVGDRPWAGGAAEAPPFDSRCRVNPPLCTPEDALALAAGIADGTVDAIATDHAPHASVAKDVEFGDAAVGISGLETALGLVLAAVEAGAVELEAAVDRLARGAERVLGLLPPTLEPGAVADLVVVDREAEWTVSATTLRSSGHNTPLLGRRLPGRVLVTIAQGRFAYLDGELVD